MLSECMEVFQEQLSIHRDDLILNEYMPADGTYIIVDKLGKMKSPVEIRMNKKERTIDRSSSQLPDICFYDYYSQLVSMNKPQDPGKIVQSNNYLSFFVKKENVTGGKLTEEVIERYYSVLSNPKEKYKKSKEASRLYEALEEKIGKVDLERLERNKTWIKEHIFALEEVVDFSKKEYLKIFFEEDAITYIRESERYFLPNIYNSNDYNVEVEGEVLGLPDNNLGMNAKKPYLSIKTRKCAAPYLLGETEVMLQKKFFDYLMNFAAAGKYNIYVDLERREFHAYKNREFPIDPISGFFLRVQKGKELEIRGQDVVPYYNNVLRQDFLFENIMGIEHKQHVVYNYQYHLYKKRSEIEQLIDEIFFSKYLANNYFSEVDSININDGNLKQNIIMAREVLFDWLYKENESGVLAVIDKVSLNLIKGSIQKGYGERAIRQISLRWSLIQYLQEGAEDMGSILKSLKERMKEKVNAEETMEIEEDQEYYFAIGQMVAYLISLSKTMKKTQSLVNPFLNAKSNEVIREKLKRYYMKYNYAIWENSKKQKNMMAMIEGYVPQGKVDQDMIIMGYTCSNFIYEKEEKDHE